MAIRSVPPAIVAVTCALVVGTASIMALHSVSLAADGAFYLVRLIRTGEFVGPDFRYLGGAIRQAPVLAATRAGLSDTHVLAIILSTGVLVLPALAWSAALVFTRRRLHAFTAVATTAGLCAGTTWFFSIGENVIAVPLTVLVASLLWLPRPWNLGHAALALAASAVLVATYESALVTGSILAVWASLRARRAWRGDRAAGRVDRWGVLAVAAVSALSVAAAVVAVGVGRQHAQNQTHVQSLLYHVVSLEPWQLYLGLVAAAAITAALTPEVGGKLGDVLLALGGIAGTVAIVGLAPTTARAFAARGGVFIAAVALLLFLFWDWRRESSGVRVVPAPLTRARARLLLCVPVVFVAGMLAADLRALPGWARGLEAFQAEVDRTTGVASVDRLPADRRQLIWGWTATSLSVVVRRRADAGILVDTDPSFVPFPPNAANEQLAERYVWSR